jgi:hypothetical protein
MWHVIDDVLTSRRSTIAHAAASPARAMRTQLAIEAQRSSNARSTCCGERNCSNDDDDDDVDDDDDKPTEKHGRAIGGGQTARENQRTVEWWWGAAWCGEARASARAAPGPSPP